MKKRALQKQLKIGFDHPLVLRRNLDDHYNVSGILHRGNKILLIYNKKYDFWTIPTGKVKLDKVPLLGFVKEMNKTLGIDVVGVDFCGSFDKTYHRDNNTFVNIHQIIYDVYSYDRDVINNESHEYSILRWMTLSEIQKISKCNISDSLYFYFNLIKILNR
jgi:ADP-ribose pyrophosphatase YjhB (NUDIX family)